jgi:outer membrane lipoprotein
MTCARPPLLSIVRPLGLATLLGLAGCATTGSDCTPQVGNPTLTPAQVSATGAHSGALQRWGGTLVATRNLPDSTELEVISYPLNRCGKPRVGEAPTGRFLVHSRGFLEPMDYQPGRQVTATGLIADTREGQVGDAPYRFPVLNDGKVRLWPSAEQMADEDVFPYPYPRPWVSIGIGGGRGGWGWGGWGGGIGVQF